MSRLNVELYGTTLGTLSQKERGFSFEINPDVFNKYQLSSTIMSLAVPLNFKFTNAQKRNSSNFFTELLPEGRNYEWLIQTLPRGEQNNFGMLRKFGKDIAGALTIYDPDDSGFVNDTDTEFVDDKQIRYLLEHMPQAALANSPTKGRTSLGGVQGKIVLAKKNDSWYRVYNGYPSTHILKPFVHEYPTMIYDEAFCMKIAHEIGLTAYPVWVESFDGTDALVVERYDRKNDSNERIHQEDFNQVLGASGSEKYQEYGGKVSAKKIAQTLARFGSDEDVEKFASQLIFAIAIGNLDMHAKNVSILHLPDDSIKLAPAYDHVPLRHQNTDSKMALAIDGEYFHANITMKKVAAEMVSWRCRSFPGEPEAVAFVERFLDICKVVIGNTSLSENAYPRLTADISMFISNLLNGKSVGRIE
ncbi:MAG: HipA domain-containing protein [Oscillospiraceae bacterium]|nr:HipA domain-containing protein [Oscillospiraceae bacterium]